MVPISRRFMLGELCEAVSAFHSLIHRAGTISRGSYLAAGPNQLFGAITMPPFISAPSHAPHQLNELFAAIACPHSLIRKSSPSPPPSCSPPALFKPPPT